MIALEVVVVGFKGWRNCEGQVREKEGGKEGQGL